MSEINSINGYEIVDKKAREDISAMNDFIVEQGEVSIPIPTGHFGGYVDWIYRKWNNGVAECWGKTPVFVNGSHHDKTYMYNEISLPIHFGGEWGITSVNYGVNVSEPFREAGATSYKVRVLTKTWVSGMLEEHSSITPYVAYDGDVDDNSIKDLSLTIYVVGKWK